MESAETKHQETLANGNGFDDAGALIIRDDSGKCRFVTSRYLEWGLPRTLV